jgi:hypothetical protein
MPTPRRYTLWALLLGSLPSCGGDGAGNTCIAKAITYTGSKSGAAYLRIRSDDGGRSLSWAGNSADIRFLIAAENGTYTCFGGGPFADTPATATVWIDVSGTETATCSDQQNQQCVPAPSDPQGHHSIVVNAHQTNWFRVDVADPP